MDRSLIFMVFVAAFSAVSVVSVAGADWAPAGNPICTANGQQSGAMQVSDGAGGTIVVWRDSRRGNSIVDLYAQRLLVDGSIDPRWPTNGALLVGSGEVERSQAVSDGQGGVLVLWSQRGAAGGVRVQRLQGDGSLPSGWPPDGKLLSSAGLGANDEVDWCAPDGMGGAYFIRDDWRPSGDSVGVVLSRVDREGQYSQGWSQNGIETGQYRSWLDPPIHFSLVADGLGGAFVGAAFLRYPWYAGQPGHGVVSRYTAAGQLTLRKYLTGPDVLPVASDESQVAALSLTGDGSGGAFVTWRTPPRANKVFGQHLAPDGVTLWPAGLRLPVVGNTIHDGSGGMYQIVPATELNEPRAVHWDASGALAPGWTWAGVPLGAPTALGEHAAIVSAGNLIVTWSDNNSPPYRLKLRASILQANGALAPGWASGGTPLCAVNQDQREPSLLSDEIGGAFVCWTSQSDTSSDIYATRIVTDGPVPVLASVASAVGHNNRAELRWFVAHIREELAVLRSTSSPIWEEVGRIRADSKGYAMFTDQEVIPGSRHGYRLQSLHGTRPLVGSEVWVDIPAIAAFGLGAIRPNPASERVRIQFATSGDTPARLEVMDVTGRMLEHMTVNSAALSGSYVELPLRGLKQGLYWVRLVQGNRSDTATFIRGE